MTQLVPILRDGVIIEVPADTVFTPTEPQPPQVPQSVTPAQAKLALYMAGRYNEAEAAIAAAGVEAQIFWTSALEFRRDHPLIAGIGAALELTSVEIDELFIVAKGLTL